MVVDCLCVWVSVCSSECVSVCFTRCVSLCHWLCECVCSLTLRVSVCLSDCMWQTFWVSVSLRLKLNLTVCQWVCLIEYLSVSESLCECLCLCVCRRNLLVNDWEIRRWHSEMLRRDVNFHSFLSYILSRLLVFRFQQATQIATRINNTLHSIFVCVTAPNWYTCWVPVAWASGNDERKTRPNVKPLFFWKVKNSVQQGADSQT